MGFLKNLRLQFQGELHEIYLVNFSVDPAELEDALPAPLRLRLVNGRALISMVDVRLMNMKAKAAWLPFKFHYQHVAFRVLVQDAQWNADGQNHGIYFLRSFTDNPRMVSAGNLLTNYRLELAHLENYPSGLRIRSGDQRLEYQLTDPVHAHEQDTKSIALQTTLSGIDRAWAMEENELQKTQIMREKWPLEAMNCNRFNTNFFESAKLEGVFRVPETIHYTWLPAETIETFTRQPIPFSTELSYA